MIENNKVLFVLKVVMCVVMKYKANEFGPVKWLTWPVPNVG